MINPNDIVTLSNSYLNVQVNTRGGSLWSIEDTEETQFLWQGDSKTWSDRALTLFPYIARLTNGKYIYEGQEYSMDIHGFAKDTQFHATSYGDQKVILTMEDSDYTLFQYPFRFRLDIEYELVESTIIITYYVYNRDLKTMYFGIGGHPGFCVPIEKGLQFDDYKLEFSKEASPFRVGMSEDCFVQSPNTVFALQGNRTLPLEHSLFDQDAIILGNMGKEVQLYTKKGRKGITVFYPKMNYLGLWHWPKTKASYLCIEPWTSLPSRKNIVEDITSQPGLIGLPAGGKYVNSWSIRIHS